MWRGTFGGAIKRSLKDLLDDFQLLAIVGAAFGECFGEEGSLVLGQLCHYVVELLLEGVGGVGIHVSSILVLLTTLIINRHILFLIINMQIEYNYKRN